MSPLLPTRLLLAILSWLVASAAFVAWILYG